jgi:hypothetical protein
LPHGVEEAKEVVKPLARRPWNFRNVVVDSLGVEHYFGRHLQSSRREWVIVTNQMIRQLVRGKGPE